MGEPLDPTRWAWPVHEAQRTVDGARGWAQVTADAHAPADGSPYPGLMLILLVLWVAHRRNAHDARVATPVVIPEPTPEPVVVPPPPAPEPEPEPEAHDYTDLRLALKYLGYGRIQANEVIAELDHADTETMVRAALLLLKR